jgi:hypothetical protein
MKSSCLFKTLIIATILLAGIFYFFTNTPGFVKQKIVDFSLRKVKERLEISEAGAKEKELVRHALQEYTEQLVSQKDINLNQVSRVGDTLSKMLKDNVITEEESQSFKKYIEEVIKNERRKKD